MLLKELIQLTEARRNPEQNPKTPMMKLLKARLDATSDEVAGFPNLWVQFSNSPELAATLDDPNNPAGIYAVSGQQAYNKIMREAGTSGWDKLPYAIAFRLSGNIVNLASADGNQLNQLMSAVYQKALRQPGIYKQELESIKQEIANPKNFKQFTFGNLFYQITQRMAELVAQASGGTVQGAWRKLLMSTGVDGIVYSNKTTVSIIDKPQRRFTTIIFNRSAITDVETLENRYHVGATRRNVAFGRQRQAIEGMTVDQVIEVVRKDPEAINAVKDDAIRVAAMQQVPASIRELKKPRASDIDWLIRTFRIGRINPSVLLRTFEQRPSERLARAIAPTIVEFRELVLADELAVAIVEQFPWVILEQRALVPKAVARVRQLIKAGEFERLAQAAGLDAATAARYRQEIIAKLRA